MNFNKAHFYRHFSEYLMIFVFAIAVIATGFKTVGLVIGFIPFLIIMIYNILVYDFVFEIKDEMIIVKRDFLWINQRKEYCFDVIK
jgi:uncharacterized protein YqgC (DUF456 family)